MARSRNEEIESGTSESSKPTDGTAAQPSDGAASSKRSLAPGLHVVATPIGNAADITLRALEILRGVDLIACEDTRVSAKLLAIHGISTPRLAYHDHNAERMRPVLLEKLRAGQRIALISDAGTPLVSDPGYKLVREAVAAGLPVQVAPGPSAPLAALVLSGLPTDRFLFAGFLDAKTTARRKQLAELKELRASLIFFESAPRLVASLADMAAVLGDRPAAVARELTKFYEEVVRGTLETLAERYATTGPPKGEIVIVVGAPLEPVHDAAEIEALLKAALARLSVRDAAAEVAAVLKMPRRDVYAKALTLVKS
jgi:16S rRNA (cytidine1402-2'-O)-methyltransferase